jgi:hypothetical protein
MRRFICEKIDKNGDAICSVILMKMLEENEEEVVKSGVGCFQVKFFNYRARRNYWDFF